MKHLLFDTETTGLIQNSLQPLAKQPQIIEFFGLMLDDEKGMEGVATLHSFLNPGKMLEPVITKITGITNDQLADKPSFLKWHPALVTFIQSADIAVAHNLSYDKAVVDFEFQRLDMKVEWPGRLICTVEATEHMKGYRLNLTALHTELFGEPFAKAHSAENDVRAMARCYVELHGRGAL